MRIFQQEQLRAEVFPCPLSPDVPVTKHSGVFFVFPTVAFSVSTANCRICHLNTMEIADQRSVAFKIIESTGFNFVF